MKFTLITGASGGIGEAIAHKMAENKDNLVLVARNESKLQGLCSQLENKYHITARYIAADLTKADAPAYVYNQCHKLGYEIHSLVNNAGIGSGGEFATISLQSELDMLHLNLDSVLGLTHYFLQDMKARKQGTIVTVGSMISYMPVPYMATYGATKAFIRFFTQALYEECKPYHIHVMLLSPGLTTTNFLQAAKLENETGRALTAASRTQTPGQVAEEFMVAYNKKQKEVVTGVLNKIGARVLSFIPNRFIARTAAASYQKGIKQ